MAPNILKFLKFLTVCFGASAHQQTSADGCVGVPGVTSYVVVGTSLASIHSKRPLQQKTTRERDCDRSTGGLSVLCKVLDETTLSVGRSLAMFVWRLPALLRL